MSPSTTRPRSSRSSQASLGLEDQRGTDGDGASKESLKMLTSHFKTLWKDLSYLAGIGIRVPHFTVLWKIVVCNPMASLPTKLVPDFLQVTAIRRDNVLNGILQRRDREAFCTDSDDVAIC